MSIIIQATGISQPDKNISAIDHAIEAARSCIEAAQVALDDIDLLINVGVYRDNNLCEPAVAALIQNALGINLNPVTHPVGRTVLAFDLMNGACGMLNALQVASSLLKAKGLKRALLVSGEGHPSKVQSESFPIVHSGAALLIEKGEGDKGFKDFVFESSKDFKGQTGVLDLQLYGTQSRSNVQVLRDANYVLELGDFTCDVVERFLKTHELDKTDLSLVSSHPDSRFAKDLSEKTGVSLAFGVDKVAQWGDSHTTALGLGAHFALQDPQGNSKKALLFVGAGSGLTSGCGLYLL
ncbi:MAG: hypothetical protein CMK59_09745 [Proteobacteria bacterium]|nr:hypothetical protein [Pseudomonadota bacterium]